MNYDELDVEMHYPVFNTLPLGPPLRNSEKSPLREGSFYLCLHEAVDSAGQVFDSIDVAVGVDDQHI